MDMEALEARVKSLDDRLRTIEDVEEIEIIQVMYGSYLEYGMWEEVVGLFSDNAESIELVDSGVYLGKAGVDRVCRSMGARRVPMEASRWKELRGMAIPRTFFHVLMLGQGVVDVDPGGKVAYGRWRGVENASRPGDGFGVAGTWIQYWGRGIYENDYIKEDGKWRIKKLHWYLTFLALYENGWLKPMTYSLSSSTLPSDKPSTFDHRYPDPEWSTVPFHYKHPITGK
jgi:hypothetical protein